MKLFLVLKRSCNEGVVFDNREDAEVAAMRRGQPAVCSTLADVFRDIYGDADDLDLIEIDVPAPKPAEAA